MAHLHRCVGRVRRASLALLLLLLFVSLAGCGRAPSEDIGSRSEALSVKAGGVLGFEDPALWRVSAGQKSSSTVHSEGTASLELQKIAWVEVVSPPLATSDVGNPAEITFDLMLPAAQPNPWWFGAAQLYLESPSHNLYTAYVGQNELTGRPTQQFFALSFAVPTWIQQQLAGGATDLTMKIALNVPEGTAPYRLDRLVLRGAGNGGAAGLAGRWGATLPSDLEQPIQVVLQLGTDGKYRITANSGDVALSDADGTWSADAETLRLSPKHCSVLDADAQTMLATTEDCAEESSPYRIEGGTLKVKNADPSTPGELEYRPL
jgi:hypothetical protein